LVKVSPRQVALEAALPHRVVVASSALQTLVADSAQITRPHRAILSAAVLHPQATHSVEEPQALVVLVLPTTQPTLDQDSHSVEAMHLLQAAQPKAPPRLRSSPSPRKMALALVRPALIRVSQCSHNTRPKASKS
jgi:hypothetical protein